MLHTHAYMHIPHIRPHIHIYTPPTHVHIHVYMQKPHIHTHIHTCAHMHTRTYQCIHTRTQDTSTVVISAATGDGMDELRDQLKQLGLAKPE